MPKLACLQLRTDARWVDTWREIEPRRTLSDMMVGKRGTLGKIHGLRGWSRRGVE
jgi:hypothetical protein